MDCHEARHLLSLGILPGAADPVRTVLGFHLSRCSSCRTYRIHLHNQQLLYNLLTHEPATPMAVTLAAPSLAHRATSTLRAASAAVLVGSMLALNPLAHATPSQAAEAPPVPCAVQAAPHMATARQNPFRGSEHASRARLAASTKRVEAAVHKDPVPDTTYDEGTLPEGMATIGLQAGTALLIPALSDTPEDIAAAPLEQSGSLGTYVVQWGDTLSGIAYRYYGNANLWYVIYNANQGIIGANPSWIYEGQRLTIPAFNGQTNPPQTGQGPGYYNVRSGDTLSAIALYAYGNANLWYVIYNANQGMIGGNPNLIMPGQELSIPSAATAQTPANPNPQQAVYSGPTGYYQVLGGDSLSAIAEKVYGNANLWYVIYNANQGVIGGDPNLIYPGQQFTIPGVV